jgi:hypothetical protein
MPDKNKILLSKPKDKSLQAYKAWINELSSRFGPEGLNTEEPTDKVWEE